MPAELPQSLLRSLTAAQVRLFAVRSGWKPVAVRRGGPVLNHPTDDLTQIHLPADLNDPDYTHRMHDAVLKLAATEGRDPAELLYDLTLPPADVLHLRLRSHDAAAGTLPLHLGVQLFASGQQLLTAAACSAHSPQAFYKNTTYAPVTKFLERCRMGQSRNGDGYAATFAAPVTPDPQRSLSELVTDLPPEEVEALALADAPFERRVTLTLMGALHTLRTGLDAGGQTVTADGVSRGVSANLCDALTALAVEDQRAVLDVSVGWSKSISRVPQRIATAVSFSQPEFSFLAATSRELKRLETRLLTVSGPVVDLHANPTNLFDEFEGNVTVRAELDGQSRSVKFTLREAEYRRACDAHRDRSHVSVTGVVAGDVSSRIFALSQPRNFRIVPQSAPAG